MCNQALWMGTPEHRNFLLPRAETNLQQGRRVCAMKFGYCDSYTSKMLMTSWANMSSRWLTQKTYLRKLLVRISTHQCVAPGHWEAYPVVRDHAHGPSRAGPMILGLLLHLTVLAAVIK